MSLNLVGLVIGLFVVPAGLLFDGHGLRRRSRRLRRAFWGGVFGFIVAILPMTLATLIPAEAWGPEDPFRIFLIYWALAGGALLGGLIGFFRPVR